MTELTLKINPVNKKIFKDDNLLRYFLEFEQVFAREKAFSKSAK